MLSEAQKDYLDRLMPLNIEARYPVWKDGVFETLETEMCEQLIKKTEEFIRWRIKARF